MHPWFRTQAESVVNTVDSGEARRTTKITRTTRTTWTTRMTRITRATRITRTELKKTTLRLTRSGKGKKQEIRGSMSLNKFSNKCNR